MFINSRVFQKLLQESDFDFLMQRNGEKLVLRMVAMMQPRMTAADSYDDVSDPLKSFDDFFARKTGECHHIKSDVDEMDADVWICCTVCRFLPLFKTEFNGLAYIF